MVNSSTDDNNPRLQPWMIYSTIAIVVIVGGYLVYASWTEETKPVTSPWICTMEGCENLQDILPKLGDPPPPLVCNKCNNKTLVPAFPCANCNNYMVMNYWRGKSGPTECPKCGVKMQYDD
ncbi:MAG: hypothetical protein ACYTF1_07345 [Planctomycetota bacterium]|jgi:hypothetical protein